MKKTIFLLMFLFLIPSAFAATISPNSWTLTLMPGQTSTNLFNITLDANESCTVNKTGVGEWVIAPTTISGSITNLPLTIKVPEGKPPSTEDGEIKYCGATVSIYLNISSSSQAGCPAYLTIYGKPIAGKTVKFEIRDNSYYRVKNTDTIIDIESTESGEKYSVECPTGSCSWEIPEGEKGSLILEVVTPGCEALTKEMELKMMGSLVISAPTELNIGKDFYIFIYDPASGPVKYATVQIIGPTGNVFNGKTNENGILYDEALIKRYGIDIKPTEEGTYKIQASLIGYNPANSEFKLVKEECPFECCVGGSYIEKSCQEGYECKENKCVKIVKPKMKIVCEPSSPIVYDEVSCKLLDPNNNLITANIQASLKYGDKEETITFLNGLANYTVLSTGKYTLSTPDTDSYSGDVYTMTVEAPPIPWLWVAVVLIILIVVIIAIILIIRRKRVPEAKYELQVTPALVEKVVTEK